jgi:hypothetical protein
MIIILFHVLPFMKNLVMELSHFESGMNGFDAKASNSLTHSHLSLFHFLMFRLTYTFQISIFRY